MTNLPAIIAIVVAGLSLIINFWTIRRQKKTIEIYQKTIGIKEKTTEILEAILDRAKNKTDDDTYNASRMCISCGKSYPEGLGDLKICPHCFPHMTVWNDEDEWNGG
jgi:hypothetical protein